ncbi:hypothetical protein J31TS4_15990 [Paenibacillus sp. J31TS4]|uniref:transcriptional regulator n=1 Tax=Paenibacillus sp. J31TS4 TaxID=2807195 RepID=UPI001B09A405|nr:transcriptional regulator [Paenibacillus sp. J31TS4]GIP38319.1 hypothetical protein J31TS4_15990 [Paenibacillus sp. J31TS4]
MMAIRKSTFKHVESELYTFHETGREIIRLKNEIIHGSGTTDENVGGGKSNLPGDPTSRVAVLLTSHRKLENLERIHDAIQSVYAALPEDRQQLVKLKYWTRPQQLTWDGIAMQLGISRITAIRWRDGIVQAVSDRIGWR